MPVTAQTPVITYTASGTGTVFAYPYKVLEEGDLAVYVNNALVSTGYTVAGTGVLTGGTVTFATAPAIGSQVRLQRSIPRTRSTDYIEGGALQAEVLDADFDRMVMMLQDIEAANTVNDVYASSIFVETFTATQGQTLFTLNHTYATGTNRLDVSVNGDQQIVGIDYAETSGSSFTFLYGLTAGDRVHCRITQVYAGATTTAELVGYGSSSNVNAALDSALNFSQAGTGAVSRTVQTKLRDVISVKDFGATGNGTTNDTAAVQAAVNAVLTDVPNGAGLYFPQGKYMLDEITVDLDLVVPAGAGRLVIYGDGQSTQLTIRSTPNQNIFNIKKTSGSFSLEISRFRFAVATQGNNLQAAAINIDAGSTQLDFQICDIYFNGLPRGITGHMVSGVISNCIFDYMSDYAIYSDSKEFRKIEIVGCHFYKMKDSSIYIDGSAASDANRDNAQAGGHLLIGSCGFDRLFDNTVTCDQIVLKGLDNFVINGCWFNGKTPSDTDSPHDFVNLDDCRNFVISGCSAYYFNRGLYVLNSEHFRVGTLQVRQGNLAASGASGAAHIEGCSDFVADISTFESQGAGVLAKGCTDFTLLGHTTKAQLSGVVISDCLRGRVQVTVIDANQANSGTAANQYGIAVTGIASSSGIALNGCNSYVTDVAQGQVVNLFLGPVSDQCRVIGGSLTSVRTSGSAVTNSGTSNKFFSVRGITTKASGQATLTNPAVTSVVTHGLTFTPSIADIRLSFNDAASGITRLFPSAVGATTFTVNANAAPTTTAVIGWFADTEH